MDGVLSDTYARFFEMYEKETGHIMPYNETIGKLEEEAFPNQRKWVTAPGFFRHLPVMEGSKDGLIKLSERYEIIVASLATEFPNSLTEKLLWLHDNFPFISWKQIVFCGNKSLIKADIMIDDHPKNLDHFDGRTLMFSQPNNLHLVNTGHQRVNSWYEIQRLLL